MPLNERDRKALKIGGIVAAVLVLGLLALGQLGKGGGSALPPLSVGPPVSGGPTGVTGVPSTGPSGSVSPSQSGGPVPSPIFSGRDPFSLPPQFPQPGGTSGGTGPVPTGTSSNRLDRRLHRFDGRHDRSRTDRADPAADERVVDDHRRS